MLLYSAVITTYSAIDSPGSPDECRTSHVVIKIMHNTHYCISCDNCKLRVTGINTVPVLDTGIYAPFAGACAVIIIIIIEFNSGTIKIELDNTI